MSGLTSDRPSRERGGWKCPPGWYSDPHGLPAVRWWDGHQWTVAVTPVADATGSARGTPAATAARATPSEYLSDDGLWRWDGHQWVAVNRKTRKPRRWKIVVGIVAALGLLGLLLWNPETGQASQGDYAAGMAVTLMVMGTATIVLILLGIGHAMQKGPRPPAERAGRIAGDAVNANTMTPESAGDAWQQWADQGGPAGEDYLRGYLTTGAAPWW